MKILVLGGTGLIGKKVCNKLAHAGHEVIVGSPSKGIDLISGEGLATALKGTDVVIDLSNSSNPEEATAISFFTTAAENLMAVEKTSGVKHHLVLSIVGTDKAQYIGYLRAKKVQEDAVKTSGIPYTIIRSTQFHEHVDTIIAVQSEGQNVHVSTLDYQPIAAEDVADYVAGIALETPENQTVDIAGPERAPMNEFVERYLNIKGIEKTVLANNDNKYMFLDLPKSGLVPDGDFRAGKIWFDNWAGN